MPFDPVKTREVLVGPRGYQLHLTSDYAWTKSVGGLGNSAHTDMEMAVRCMLVGLDEAAQKLLDQAHRWLSTAIAENERPRHYGPNGTEALRWQDMALCEWLLHGRHDANSLQRYVEYKDKVFEDVSFANDRTEVAWSLAGYLDAGAYRRALELFQGVRGLNAPQTAGRTSSEAQMAYVLCKRELENGYSDEEVSQSGNAFLSRHVDKFLSDARYLDIVRWLKILCWNRTDRNTSAKQIVMKCYDYLPGRAPRE